MLSSLSLIESHPLIEELIAGRQGLGAELSFEPNTLEVKPNQHGVSGVFTRRALSEGTEVISVPQLNGSLTGVRAYEEAQELLQRLGSDRFNVNEKFVIACAMYLRFANTAAKHSDLLITEPDLKSAYSGSPMTAYNSLDLAQLLEENSRACLDEAVEMDEQIKKMNVDPELFRAMLAYTTSRTWQGLGLIPVLDRFNSSYVNGANCEFCTKKGRLTYTLLRDVGADEELVWNYNNSSAVDTWLNYGYIDYERPTVARLEWCVSEEEKIALENFAIEKLGCRKNHVSLSYKIDDCKFSFMLSNPGKLPASALIRNSIAESLTAFVSVRKSFRIFMLSGGGERNLGAITVAKLVSDEPIFGLEFEGQVVACMRTALENGLLAGRKRAERFTASELGCSIDIAPYIDMMESASGAWEDALAAVEVVCSAQNMEDCITAINSALELSIQSEDEIKPALEEIDAQRPTLIASLIQKYIQVRI